MTTVAEFVAAWFESNIFKLLDGTGTPRARVSLVAERLKKYYSKWCESQHSQRSIDPVGSRGTTARASQNDADVGRCVYQDRHRDAVDLRFRAQDPLIRIEGSLIFARTAGNGAAFERTLMLLPDSLFP